MSKVLFESFTRYLRNATEVEIGDTFRELYGDTQFLKYTNDGDEKGLLSLAGSSFPKDVWNKLTVVEKKDRIRNFKSNCKDGLNIRDMRMTVVVDQYNRAMSFVRDYSDRIDLICFVEDAELKKTFIDVNEYLSFAENNKVDFEYSKYGLLKTHNQEEYTYMYDGELETINLVELTSWLSYLDLGEFDPTFPEDPMAAADSRARNRNYEVVTYAGGDRDAKTLVGGADEHNEANVAKHSYIISNCSSAMYLTPEMLHERIEYVKAVRKFIKGHRCSESLFYDLDVIECPHCKNKMRYSLAASYSICRNCNMAIPNPGNVDVYSDVIDHFYTKLKSKSWMQAIAKAYYAEHGYVTAADENKSKKRPDWMADDRDGQEDDHGLVESYRLGFNKEPVEEVSEDESEE